MAYGGYSTGFGSTPWVKRLIIANVAVFLLTFIASRAGAPLFGWLALQPSSVLFRPWTLLTYMFVHGDFWHILFNMLMLYFFGRSLEERWGSREFLKYYIVCGLGAAALSFIFAYNASIVGASGAVYGVMVAFAMLWPDAQIYFWGIFPIAAKWLVGALVGFSLLMTLGGAGDGIAHAAHLGGAAAGFFYLRLSDTMTARIAQARRRMSRPKLTVTQGAAKPEPRKPLAPPTRRSVKEERLLDEVDRVLDKISASGMASLTPEERRVLDEVSKRYRKD